MEDLILTKKNLQQICYQIFSLCKIFYFETDITVSFDTYRDAMMQAFNEFDARCQGIGIESDQLEAIKYAMTAFIDELIMRSNWSAKDQWMSHSLQAYYFAEHLAGEGFFIRLASLRQDPMRNIDVLEIYYLCLMLGFEGKYCLQDMAQLQAIQTSLQQQINHVRGHRNISAVPHIQVQGRFLNQLDKELPYWIIVGLTIAIMLLIVLGDNLAIKHQHKAAVNLLNDNILKINKQLKTYENHMRG